MSDHSKAPGKGTEFSTHYERVDAESDARIEEYERMIAKHLEAQQPPPFHEGPIVVGLGDLAKQPPAPDGCPFGFSSSEHKAVCRFEIEFTGQYAMKDLRCEMVRPFTGKDKNFFALQCNYAKPAIRDSRTGAK